MLAGSDSTVVPPAGWYPDPADALGVRWWTGAAWTEHVAPVAAAPVVPAQPDEDEFPDLTRFARDPVLRRAEEDEPIPAVHRRDPYRERNMLAGLALVVALLSVPGTIASIFWVLPDLVSYVITGAPIVFGLLGLVASIKLGLPTRMAWLALAISMTTMIAGWVISAQQLSLDVPMPSVTDVPGVNEIRELEGDAGLGG